MKLGKILFAFFIVISCSLSFAQETKPYDISQWKPRDIRTYRAIPHEGTLSFGEENSGDLFLQNIIFDELLAKRAAQLNMHKDSTFALQMYEQRDKLLTDLFMQDIRKSIKVSDEEIENYYEENKDEFVREKTRKLSYIFFDYGDENPTDDMVRRTFERAKEIHGKLESGADFKETAIKYSDAPSGRRGGSLGYMPKGKYQAFDEEAWSLKIGEISDPIKTKYGYCIIKVEDEKESETVPIEKVKSSINSKLRQEKTQRMLESIKAEYKEKKKIGINLETLNDPRVKDTDIILWVADFQFTYMDFLKYLDRNHIDRQLRINQKVDLLTQILDKNIYANIAIDKGYDKREDFVKQIRFIQNKKLADAYIEKEVSRLKYSNNDLKMFFGSNPELFKQYTKRRVNLIYISAGDVSGQTSQARIHYAFKRIEPIVEEVQAKLNAREDFEKIATEYSDDQSAKFGGDLGWLQLPYKKELDYFIRTAQINKVVGPIKVIDGYYFLKLSDIRPPEYEDIKPEVTEEFMNFKRIEIRKKLRDELFEKNEIEIEERLND